MNEKKINTLIECLFTIVSSFNAVVDRLDILTDRHEKLLKRNNDVFTKIKEEFWRKVIEYEVNKEIQKNQKSKERSVKFGSDIVR